MTLELKINDNIPNFSLPLSDDTLFNSEELKKKLYIIYFYPKDNTPGCTNEAKDFSSLKKDFDTIDAEVIGISKDSEFSKSSKFAENRWGRRQPRQPRQPQQRLNFLPSDRFQTFLFIMFEQNCADLEGSAHPGLAICRTNTSHGRQWDQLRSAHFA